MNNIIFLQGARVQLRALMEEDLNDEYLQWLNDEDVCRGNAHAIFPNTREKMKTYFNSLNSTTNQVVLAIIATDTGKHIGNVALQNINWVARNAEFAIVLGNKDYWKGGYGAEAASLIVDYGFQRLNLHRIYCGTFASNGSMIRLAQKLRMKEEGRRRQAAFKNGTYEDIIEFGVLKVEFFENEVL